MFKKLIVAACVLASSGCASQAQQPDPGQVYAWYREDGVQTNGSAIKAWNSAGAIGGAPGGERALAQVVGAPRVTKVKTPNGEKSVVTLDGTSALWAKKESWKQIDGDVTVVVFFRLRDVTDGFLFDGSSTAGMTRAQVRNKNWQIGVQPAERNVANVAGNADSDTFAAQKDAWQAQAFIFNKNDGSATQRTDGASKTVSLNQHSPFTGIILGANVAAKGGLRADIAEVLVYDRALTTAEADGVLKYLKDKWGTPEIGSGAIASTADKDTIAAKLADKSKPILWLWSGHNANLKTLGAARDEPQHFAERVRWELQRRRDIVMDTRTMQKEDLEKNFEARIARFQPTVVVLNLDEGDNAAALINRVRKIGAIPIVQSGTQQAASLRKATAEEGAILVESQPLAAGGNATAAKVALNDTVAIFRALGIDSPQSSVDALLN